MFKQIATVIAHGQVEGAVEAALLLTQLTHLMVPWSTDDTQYSGAALHILYIVVFTEEHIILYLFHDYQYMHYSSTKHGKSQPVNNTIYCLIQNPKSSAPHDCYKCSQFYSVHGILPSWASLAIWVSWIILRRICSSCSSLCLSSASCWRR